MSKQWWSSRQMFVSQTVCLLALVVWSTHHSPAGSGNAGRSTTDPKFAPDAVIDNSEGTVAADNVGEVDARFVVPPTVRFRTDNPPAGSLNLRPVEGSSPQHTAPWQPLRPQNPPQRVPGGPRSPFEVDSKGVTVYNAPPPDAD